MKKVKKTISILWILILHVVLLGQKETTQLFEPTLIKADIDTLISKLIDVHPTFSNYYETHNLKNKIDSIKNNINNPMSSLDFFRIMQPIVVIDGHTTLRYTDGLCPNENSPLFPFKVVIFNNTLYIKENLSKNEDLIKGSIIEKINGVSSEKIFKNLLKYIPGEKEYFKIKKLEKDFHIYLALVYGSFSDFNITINKAEFKLKGANWDAFHGSSKPKFELKFYDDDIAYIYKRMFMPPKDFLHFMDSAFTVISERQINYLIIDNLQGGGLTDLADSLLSYFAERPYSLLEKKMTKISFLTKEFIEDKKNEGYVQDDYFVQEYQKHNAIRTDRFTGSTFILTGPLSYSTATAFPAAIKSSQNAFIVGEETGQPLISNGDQNQFMLPTTKMFCITAISRVYMPGHNNDEVNGVFPDFHVVPTLDDILNDKAYSLEYTLNLIRENKFNNEKSVLNFKNAYLGQDLPGDTPVIFAPDYISGKGRLHCFPSFSIDNKEMYWMIIPPKIMAMREIDGIWTSPEFPSFSSLGSRNQAPFVAHDNTIYFASNREGGYGGLDIWCTTKIDSGYTTPINIGDKINTGNSESTPTLSENKTMFYTSSVQGKLYNFGIYYSVFEDGEYKNPIVLPEPINIMDSTILDYTPFIASDESYLLFCSNRQNPEKELCHIYISYKNEIGEWGEPVDLSLKMGFTRSSKFPYITPDKKFLFFSCGNDIYWLDSKIIDIEKI